VVEIGEAWRMTSTNKKSKSSKTSDSFADGFGSSVRKIDVQLDCECGEMLVPAPFVENNAMRIAYNCPKHGQIHVVDPFA
jgi:hypothetical protein